MRGAGWRWKMKGGKLEVEDEGAGWRWKMRGVSWRWKMRGQVGGGR